MGTGEGGVVDDDAHSNAKNEDDVMIPLTSLPLNSSTHLYDSSYRTWNRSAKSFN
jgi:hypothetical protein